MVDNQTKRILAFLSGGRCAMPDCKKPLVTTQRSGKRIIVGDAAHIVGEKGGGKSGSSSARYNSDMPLEQRNSLDNLIYLCKDCHKKIDTLPQGEIDYPTEYLLDIKAKHEKSVANDTMQGFQDVGFDDIERATKWVCTEISDTPSNDFSLVDLREKIMKNGLDDASKWVIMQAMGSLAVIDQFFRQVTNEDPDFPERLKHVFSHHYSKLYLTGLRQNDLFNNMCAFAGYGFSDTPTRSAAIAVLVYYFEACELFEK